MPVRGEDDRDLTGCSVEIDSYLFNLLPLSHTTRYFSYFAHFFLIENREITKLPIIMEKEMSLSTSIYVNTTTELVLIMFRTL